LSMHPNSPGYRLILNNILFPAAKKKKLKTWLNLLGFSCLILCLYVDLIVNTEQSLQMNRKFYYKRKI
jgi:hypothetical protein